jgi:hypothetical protein
MTDLVRWLAVLLWLAPAGAGAEPITVIFSGTIAEIAPTIDDGTFAVGAPVSGSFEIDSGAADGEPDPEVGRYDGAVSDLAVAFGSYEASASPGLLFIRNSMGSGADEFYVETSPTGADVAGLPLYRSILQVLDPTRAAFSSDAIPTSLDLADFEHSRLTLDYLDGTFSYSVRAEITTLTYTPAPEPGAVLSMPVGMLVLGLSRLARRSERKASA